MRKLWENEWSRGKEIRPMNPFIILKGTRQAPASLRPPLVRAVLEFYSPAPLLEFYPHAPGSELYRTACLLDIYRPACPSCWAHSSWQSSPWMRSAAGNLDFVIRSNISHHSDGTMVPWYHGARVEATSNYLRSNSESLFEQKPS